MNDLPAAVVGRIDTHQLVELCTMSAVMRKLRPGFLANPDDKIQRCQYIAVQTQFHRLASEFGMTPASRAGMKVPEDPDADDPMGDIIGRMAG